MSVSINDFAQPYKELYAIHNHLIELGFSSDEIFVSVCNVLNPPQENVLCAHLRTQGKEFVFTIAKLGSDIIKQEAHDKWTSFVTILQDTEDDDIREMLGTTISASKDALTSIVYGLLKKGFRIPRFPNIS